MGMGKTTQLKRYLEREAPRRVLMISTRVSFAQTLRGLFPDFKLYHEGGAFRSDRLICQYESLHRLPPGTAPFDLVVVDEVRSVLGNATCEATNGAHIRDNAQLLLGLLRNSARSILLDADLDTDGAVRDLLTKAFEPSAVRIQRYRRVKLPRTFRRYTRGQWMHLLKQDLPQGKRLAVCVGTRAQGEEVEAACREARVSCRFYHSGANDAILEDLKDINRAWQNFQVVIYTSKITVGADYTGPMDRVYLACSRLGAVPRNALQMVGRVRKPQDKHVRLYVDGEGQGELGTHEKCLRRLQQRRQHLKDGLAQVFDFVVDFHPVLRWTPSWLTRIRAWNDLERENASRSWERVFRTLCLQRGFVYERMRAPPVELKRFEPAAEEELFKSLPPTLTEGLPQVEERIRGQHATALDKLHARVHHVQKHWKRYKLDYRSFRKLHAFKGRIRNIAAMQKCLSARGVFALPEAVKRVDRDAVRAKPYTDAVKPLSAGLTKLDQMARAVGLKHALDTQGSFTSHQLEQQKAQHDLCLTEMSSLYGFRCRAAHASRKMHFMWSKVLGARVKRMGDKRDDQGKRVYVYALCFEQVNNASLLTWAQRSDFFK